MSLLDDVAPPMLRATNPEARGGWAVVRVIQEALTVFHEIPYFLFQAAVPNYVNEKCL